MVAELKLRIDSTQMLLRHLRNHIFKTERLPVRRKWLLKEAVAITRLACNSFTDSRQPKSFTSALRTRYIYAARCALNMHTTPANMKYFTDDEAVGAASPSHGILSDHSSAYDIWEGSWFMDRISFLLSWKTVPGLSGIGLVWFLMMIFGYIPWSANFMIFRPCKRA